MIIFDILLLPIDVIASRESIRELLMFFVQLFVFVKLVCIVARLCFLVKTLMMFYHVFFTTYA